MRVSPKDAEGMLCICVLQALHHNAVILADGRAAGVSVHDSNHNSGSPESSRLECLTVPGQPSGVQ